jgi:hypothetical protein
MYKPSFYDYISRGLETKDCTRIYTGESKLYRPANSYAEFLMSTNKK